MADGKQRHGCLTAWLVLMIVANAATALWYISGNVGRMLPSSSQWAIPVITVFGLLNVVFAIALLKWMKWGFWGFCVSAVAIFIVNIMIVGIALAIPGLAGVLILYAVLQIGGENKGWSQLE